MLRQCAGLLESGAVRMGMARGVRTKPAQLSNDEVLPDKLYKSIELEYRGHDKAVLKSYTTFLESVCGHLNITRGKMEVLPYVRWIQPLLRSKFVHKKYKLHYETRTHITKFEVREVTGSTASCLLEYVQRQLPEGVAMRVGCEELRPLPTTINH